MSIIVNNRSEFYTLAAHDLETIKCLAKIINAGKTSVPTLKLSQLLLDHYSTIDAVLKLTVDEFSQLPNFKIQYWFNLMCYRQQQLEPLKQALKTQPLQVNTAGVVPYFQQLFKYIARGGLRAIFLDQKYYYLDDMFIAVGSQPIDYNLYIQDFYLIALRLKACAVILAANQVQQPELEPFFFEQHQQLRYDLKIIDLDLLGYVDLYHHKIHYYNN